MSDSAVASLMYGLVTVTTMIVGFLTLWVKLRYGVEPKIDANTALTVSGNSQAAHNARLAATAAQAAATNTHATMVKTQEINSKLNGGVDDAIREAVGPIKKAIVDHAAEDKAILAEIHAKFDVLEKYVHDRNHDILNAMSVQINKLEVLLHRTQPEEKR